MSFMHHLWPFSGCPSVFSDFFSDFLPVSLNTVVQRYSLTFQIGSNFCVVMNSPHRRVIERVHLAADATECVRLASPGATGCVHLAPTFVAACVQRA